MTRSVCSGRPTSIRSTGIAATQPGAYPAILAAYDAVAGSPEVTGRPRSRLSCREVYVAELQAIGDGEPICDVAYPIG